MSGLETSQTLVSEHFRTTSAGWRDIYTRQDLYARLYQERRTTVISLVDQLQLSPGARVVDIGCGPGLTSVALGQRGFAVTAIDAVGAMTAMTRTLAAESGVGHRVSAAVCDIRDLALDTKSCDLLVVAGVSEWLSSLDEPLREMVRVMRPGSHLIITADNSWALHCVLDPSLNPLLGPVKRAIKHVLFRLGGRPPEPRCHLRSAGAIDASLHSAGLELARSLSFGFGPFSVLKKPLLGDAYGYAIHSKIQRLSNLGWPVIRRMGHIYIAVAKKPH